jgi:hypothetical protein
MKLTKTQTAALKTIWTAKTAYGAQDKDYGMTLRIDRAAAKTAGYGWMNFNTSSVLVRRGLVRTLVTRDTILGHRVLVMVLTDLGRAQIGV